MFLPSQHDMGHCTVASVPKALFYLDICQFRKVVVDGIFLFLGFCKLHARELFLISSPWTSEASGEEGK